MAVDRGYIVKGLSKRGAPEGELQKGVLAGKGLAYRRRRYVNPKSY